MSLQNHDTFKTHSVAPRSSINYFHECQSCKHIGGCLGKRMINKRSNEQHHKLLKSQEHLFHQGSSSNNLYVVRSGLLKSVVDFEDGSEQVLGFYMPGDVVGLDGNDGQAHLSSVIALELSSVCILPVSNMYEKSQQKEYHQLVTHQFGRNQQHLLMLAKKDTDYRIAWFLLDLSKQFELRGYKANEFELQMPRKDIANYLGMAIETVSRVFARFQNAGIMTVNHRHVVIHQPEILAATAGKDSKTH